MNQALQWGMPCLAPAKLNLFLHITGRRADGYHTLQTCFRLIGLYDTLTFFPRADGKIRLISSLEGIEADQEICVKAAALLQRVGHIRQGVDIKIEKKIPVGGGLGGGSSDAATTLLALNYLWHTRLNRSYLQQTASTLGADIPFFIFGQDAFAEGIGDQLSIASIPTAWYVVLFPPVHVPTAHIFSSDLLTRHCAPVQPEAWSFEDLHNVLTPVAVTFYPIIQTYLDWLSQFGHAKMSGSGACVFAAFPTQAAAEKVYSARPSSYHGVVVPSVTRHPLYHSIDDAI